MKIKIQELGAVKEAIIDLDKKLTVFCGPNNTGKTYLSFIIYALTNGRIFETMLLSDDKLADLFEKNELHFSIDIESLWNYRNESIKSVQDNLDNIFGISEEKAKNYFPSFLICFDSSKESFIEKISGLDLNGIFKIQDIEINIEKKKESFEVLIKMPSDYKKAIGIPSSIKYTLVSNIYQLLSFYPISKSVIFPVERIVQSLS